MLRHETRRVVVHGMHSRCMHTFEHIPTWHAQHSETRAGLSFEPIMAWVMSSRHGQEAFSVPGSIYTSGAHSTHTRGERPADRMGRTDYDTSMSLSMRLANLLCYTSSPQNDKSSKCDFRHTAGRIECAAHVLHVCTVSHRRSDSAGLEPVNTVRARHSHCRARRDKSPAAARCSRHWPRAAARL